VEEKWVGKIGCQRVSRVEDLTVANPVSSGLSFGRSLQVALVCPRIVSFQGALLDDWRVERETAFTSGLVLFRYTSLGHCPQLYKPGTESNDFTRCRVLLVHSP